MVISLASKADDGAEAGSLMLDGKWAIRNGSSGTQVGGWDAGHWVSLSRKLLTRSGFVTQGYLPPTGPKRLATMQCSAPGKEAAQEADSGSSSNRRPEKVPSRQPSRPPQPTDPPRWQRQ
jgi:hypothetical protein